MSRRTSSVKIKEIAETQGPIDIHFHGAFGIDLMSASQSDLTQLSDLLWKRGLAGFCPTTLSASPTDLAASVERLGRWIRSGKFPGAKPLGIHLEGPFLSPDACGAHPPQSIRKFSWPELENLWSLSQESLKILTLAPEAISRSELKNLSRWCQDKKIHLSLGHSQSNEDQAHQAFRAGFRGVTHAWNALSFHQRSPGPLGAALGNPDLFLELIIDQVHVSPTVIRWSLKLHPPKAICFISDCITPGGDHKNASRWQSFGSLKVRFKNGACRLPDGRLAGGGYLLPAAYCRWIQNESNTQGISIPTLIKKTVRHITTVPLTLLKLPAYSLKDRRVIWKQETPDKIDIISIDSKSTKR